MYSQTNYGSIRRCYDRKVLRNAVIIKNQSIIDFYNLYYGLLIIVILLKGDSMDQLNLDDRLLWGNEAADDEDPELLNSYFVTQNNDEWQEFFDIDVTYSIARARKGMGKSAILKECAYRNKDKDDYIVIDIKGSDLVAYKPIQKENLDITQSIFDWKQRICAIINYKLGQAIGFAVSDDAIALVENAELSGYKSRNLVSALLDRLKFILSKSSVEVNKIGSPNQSELLKRISNGGEFSQKILLLIDDIDATFRNSEEECLNLSTFFTACREISSGYKGISIRTVVRSDVWTCIRSKDEALDKVEQYIFDIKWSKKEFRTFFVNRIKAYCKRKDLEELTSNKTNENILSLVFEEEFPWGTGNASPHRVIHIYAGGRPRWAAQLCKMAGKETKKTKTSRIITFGAIKQVLVEYGRYRLEDIKREHQHQCESIGRIINCFSKQSYRFNTNALLSFIESTILNNIDNIIIDDVRIADSISMAHFLFRINFIIAAGRVNGKNDYFYYEDKPDLLVDRTNLDDGLSWIIHHSYQAALSCHGRG